MRMSPFSKVKVFAAGDLMLDRFEYGKVARISPEAPVPVFRFVREKTMLGGVGNVAANLLALGCRVTLSGAVGSDAAGEEVVRLAGEAGADAVFARPRGFQTIVKTRLIAGNNHLLRVDQESDFAAEALPAAVEARCAKAIAASDVVLLSDYAKGFLSGPVCRGLIRLARKARRPVFIDPKGTDWERYRGATLVKPNLKELSLVCGREFDPSSPRFLADVASSARDLCSRFGLKGVLVTLSEHGMLLAFRSKPSYLHVPTEAREVFDVSGAGDTALAAFGAAVGAGRSPEEALHIANAASGIVVSKLGTATVTYAELEKATSPRTASPRPCASAGVAEPSAKIVRADEIGGIVAKLRAEGRRIGFTNGCFDCCHLGHLYSLFEAKKLCDVLVVGVNSDDSVRRHKGPTRPIQDETTRATLLASLECVDYVVVFDDDVPVALVKAVRPDVIAKEGYPLSKWPEGRLVKRLGGEAVRLKRLEGHSTTELVKRMNAGGRQ